MDGTHSMIVRIIKKHWYAVGSGYAYAHTSHRGHQSIHSFQHHVPGAAAQFKKFGSYHPCFSTVRLMRHHNVTAVYTERIAQSLTVAAHAVLIITAISVYTETGIGSLSTSAVACCAERHDLICDVIIRYDRRLNHPYALRRTQNRREPLSRPRQYILSRPRPQPASPPRNGSCPCHGVRDCPRL